GRLATSPGFTVGPPSTATPTRTPVATATPTATATTPPGATMTRTSTPGAATATPYPRPNVGVQTAPGGPGQLQVTVMAREAGCTPNNQRQAVRVTQLDNATVEVAGQPPLSAPGTVPIPSGAAQASFTVRRGQAGQPVTVQLTVVDGCGAWPTFVGGGPGA